MSKKTKGFYPIHVIQTLSIVILSILIGSFQTTLALAETPSATEITSPSNQKTETVETPSPSATSTPVVQKNDSGFPYEKTFGITCYYSPLPGQKRYGQGSYAAELRMEGNGTNGADGTEVYLGMVAAPKTYPFGTKMKIPGYGIMTVHDRGGAIVTAGNRGQKYDRIDIWVGYGDAGQIRASKCAYSTATVTVYGVDASIKETATLEGYTPDEKYNQKVYPTLPSVFTSTLGSGKQGEDVKKLQEYLSKFGYEVDINGIYDDQTTNAVLKFQKDNQVIKSENDHGAGYFGPKTMQLLASKLDINPTVETQTKSVNTQDVFQNNLKLGDKNDDVKKLQEELIKLNLLKIEPNGNYDSLTTHAVFKLQQNLEILKDPTDFGAGITGPITRARLNNIISQREETTKLIAEKLDTDKRKYGVSLNN